ncbi:MAG: radical SAM protein [Desulfofustis sp.]|jgi:putative pyruvate formate lyase activating enzyme|nr:radical SAM protein [Desulfofustis sp.]
MQTKGLTCFESGALQNRASQARALLSRCRLCPRNCGVDRLNGETGVCRTAEQAIVASFSPHFGEESVLVGSNGSGTVFFAGCNLTCCFCQNYDISHDVSGGAAVAPERIASIMLDLQQRGCHNINFVTPTHVVPQILDALLVAYQGGLRLPLVYNSSGYEAVDTLKLLDGVIDIYMPDFKFWNRISARTYAAAEDYPAVARKAVREMFRQVGDLQIDERGIAVQGLLIRHLLMPGALAETEAILSFIAGQISTSTYVNIMDQYRPCGRSSEYEELRNSIGPAHYRQALACAENAGLTRLDQRDLPSLLRRLGITL